MYWGPVAITIAARYATESMPPTMNRIQCDIPGLVRTKAATEPKMRARGVIGSPWRLGMRESDGSECRKLVESLFCFFLVGERFRGDWAKTLCARRAENNDFVFEFSDFADSFRAGCP